MVDGLPDTARIFRVRTEFVEASRELRVHVLCECGSGGWIVSLAPFPELFFDERPLIGRSVGEALAWLDKRYGVTVGRGGLTSSTQGARGRGRRPGAGRRGRRPVSDPRQVEMVMVRP